MLEILFDMEYLVMLTSFNGVRAIDIGYSKYARKYLTTMWLN